MKFFDLKHYRPIKKTLKKILFGFLGLIIGLLGIVLFLFYAKFLIKIKTQGQKNIYKLLENSSIVQPTVITEPEYANVITDATGRMTYKFPIGAFGNFEGRIGITPSRHNYNFPKQYRFVMDSLFTLGSGTIGTMNKPIEYELLKPVEITAKYDPSYLQHLNISKLIFFYTKDMSDGVNNPWIKLPTKLDLHHYTASTTGIHTGNYVLVAPLLCPEDTSEFDDNYDSTKRNRIPLGQKIPRIFDIKQDEEWFRFGVKKGKTYILETSDLALGVKPMIIIYDTSGVTQIASSPFRLEWKALDKYFQDSNTMTFFINVSAQLDSKIGCDAKLNFTLSEK